MTLSIRDQFLLWSGAARGAHRDGDHEAERRYRNQARLIRGMKPVSGNRCIDGSVPK